MNLVRYECPKRSCAWKHTVWQRDDWTPAVEAVLQQHINTHPVWRRIMAHRARKLVEA